MGSRSNPLVLGRGVSEEVCELERDELLVFAEPEPNAGLDPDRNPLVLGREPISVGDCGRAERDALLKFDVSLRRWVVPPVSPKLLTTGA